MLVRCGFNDTYLVDTGREKYLFGLYLNGKYYVKSNHTYRFELDLIEHLYKWDVPVATGISIVNEEYTGVIPTVHGQRAFALFCYAEGIALGRGSVTNKQSYRLGVALANLHLAANSFESQFERHKLDVNYMVHEPLQLICLLYGEEYMRDNNLNGNSFRNHAGWLSGPGRPFQERAL